jgi:hypothetical protein
MRMLAVRNKKAMLIPGLAVTADDMSNGPMAHGTLAGSVSSTRKSTRQQFMLIPALEK